MFETNNKHFDRGTADLTAFGSQNAADTMRRIHHEITFLEGSVSLFCHRVFLVDPRGRPHGRVAGNAIGARHRKSP